MPSQHFAELFSQMVHSAMARGKWKSLTQTLDGPGLYNYLAELCSVEVSTVIGWKTKGSIPSDPNQVSQLGEFGMNTAMMTRQWLEEFLRAGQCFDVSLLRRYQPTTTFERPARARHNLPAITRDFIERPAEVSRILEGLQYGYPVSIEGFGGMGKSTLAIWVAERCLPGDNSLISPPVEHVVWISARDFPNFDLNLNNVLNAVAERTGFTGLQDLEFGQKRTEVHELLRTRRVLVIADNMETVTDPEVYEFLRRVREPSRVLITTRHKQYRSVWEVATEGLNAPNALKKIRQEIRNKDLRSLAYADDATLYPLVKMTEGNPKAIELTLGFIKRTGVPLAEAVRSLDEAAEDVEGLFPYLFERDWKELDESTRRVLLAMPLFLGETRRDALQAVTDVHKHAFKLASEQLIELSLLDVGEPGPDGEVKYTVHRLTRAFAKGQLKELANEEEELRTRWVDWCIQFAESNSRSWHTYDVLEEEIDNLVECVKWCHASQRWRSVLALEDSLMDFCKVRGHLEARARIGDLASDAAKQLGDEVAHAWVVIHAIIPSLDQLRRTEKADLACRQALSVFKKYDDKRGIAVATLYLGEITHALKGYSAARPLFDACLLMFEELDDPAHIGNALNSLGKICWREKLLEEGKQFLHRAQSTPYRPGNIFRNLGRIEVELGHLDVAEELLTRSLHLTEMEGYRFHSASTQYELARVKHLQGQIDEARVLLHKARHTYLAVGAWPSVKSVVYRLYYLEQEQGNVSAVRPVIEEMIDLYGRLDMPNDRQAMEKLFWEGWPAEASQQLESYRY